MGILIAVLIFLSIIFVVCIFVWDESDGNSFVGMVISLVIGILFINFKTTSFDKPIEVPISKISIMVDDEVAILRYKDNMETFDNVKQYKAIKDSSFAYMETKKRNVFGEYNGSTYELKVK